jgi:hypothetical protein
MPLSRTRSSALDRDLSTEEIKLKSWSIEDGVASSVRGRYAAGFLMPEH